MSVPFERTGVASVHVSGYITADTQITIEPVEGYPGEFVVRLGYASPTFALHADNEQLTRLRDVLNEHLAREAGAR